MGVSAAVQQWSRSGSEEEIRCLIGSMVVGTPPKLFNGLTVQPGPRRPDLPRAFKNSMGVAPLGHWS